MNTHTRLLSFVALLAAVTTAPAHAEAEAAVVAATAASAAAPCRAGGLTPLQQRLVEKADQGVTPFVQFIHRTRMIYQLEPVEVANQLEGWRAQGRCATASSDGQKLGG